MSASFQEEEILFPAIGKEEQAKDTDRLEDNLNDGENTNAMGKAEHLLHVLRDPTTQ